MLIAGLAYLAANRSTPSVAVAATDPPTIRVEKAPPTDPADSSPPPEPTSSAATAASPPDLLTERLTASQDWLKTVPDTHYFIQLFNADASRAREVENFLENNALDAGELRVYRSALSGRDRFGVIYGDYPSPDAANADLARVARIGRVSRPLCPLGQQAALTPERPHLNMD